MIQYDDKKALDLALARCGALYQENLLLNSILNERDEKIAALSAELAALKAKKKR